MLLSELKEGEKGIIVRVKGYGAFKRRLCEMGFIRGKEVTVVKHAPLLDPIEYRIMNYFVSLRRSEAESVEVVNSEKYEEQSINYNGTIGEEVLQRVSREKGSTINVALVGNPNAGKTTFFNYASGSSERVGNYSGVTVSVKKATFKHKHYNIEIADLPGTYSLTAYSPEERYVRDYLITEKPDIVINLVDASNLERNMFLTTQLIDMDIKVVMALNMYDELEKYNATLDHHKLGRLIGIPIIPTVSSRGRGIHSLLQKVVDIFEDKDSIVRHVHINYGLELEKAIKDLQETLLKDKDLIAYASPRFLALRLLEKDSSLDLFFEQSTYFKELKEKTEKHINIIESTFSNDMNTLLTDAHYGFASGALRECYKEKSVEKHKRTRIIDNLLTNRLFGFPVFMLFMYIAFYCTFTLGSYPMDWIDSGIGILGELIQSHMSEGMLRDLLVDGIIGGVGGVLVFLPNILILFLFISLMEDTGYMARAVFIMDKLMHKIGLHGRSFIPLVMGFGCNVPAIMATRALKSRKDRMITILVNPFMSCSARLPVYLLLIAVFAPKYPTLILFLMYIVGVILAIIMARFFRKTMFRSADMHFVMELPPYRMPTIRTLVKHMWNKGVHYLKKVSGIILIASIIVWALGYFPIDKNFNKDYEGLKKELTLQYKKDILNISDFKEKEKLSNTYNANVTALDNEKKEEVIEYTYIGRLGKAIEPLFSVMGFDWRISVALLAGTAAKEIVVSTLGILYQAGEDADENNVVLNSKLRSAVYRSGINANKTVYTPRVSFALMLFVLIYFPCIGVLSVVARETNWKWALFMAFYTTALAYIVSFAYYQISGLF